MAHRFRSMIFALLGLITSTVSFLAASAVSTANHAVHFLASAFDFRPTADQSLVLDGIRRYIGDGPVVGSMARRVTAFIKTALAHDEFSAGRYDPGWRCA